MQELMTVIEVSNLLKIRPEILRRKVRSRKIRAYKIGKEWRFSPDEVKKFLDSCLS